MLPGITAAALLSCLAVYLFPEKRLRLASPVLLFDHPRLQQAIAVLAVSRSGTVRRSLFQPRYRAAVYRFGNGDMRHCRLRTCAVPVLHAGWDPGDIALIQDFRLFAPRL